MLQIAAATANERGNNWGCGLSHSYPPLLCPENRETCLSERVSMCGPTSTVDHTNCPGLTIPVGFYQHHNADPSLCTRGPIGPYWVRSVHFSTTMHSIFSARTYTVCTCTVLYVHFMSLACRFRLSSNGISPRGTSTNRSS